MTPGHGERVRDLFDRAVELPPSERRAFLDAACGSATGTRAEVEELLRYDDELSNGEGSGSFLKSPLIRPQEAAPAPAVTDAAHKAAPLPERIGPYRVLRELGSGGMGTVFEAEQDNPRRSVAIKVIRPGLASPELVKRFAHEAQILGRLHHPRIAQIYEAGLTEQGRPYFAMELIGGISLDRYVRQHSPNVPDRLRLFVRVCDAVQHAHEKGVVHRDLKPGNILVDESGEPKVLDFGVARATADLQTASGRTEIGQLLGTLNYMSPEQIAADPALIDPRSDVYSLGVLLFELLADRLPYNLAALPLPEVARVIRDRDPSSLGSINTHLRGDVETIVAKALEKEPARRYNSAGELGSDIRRHLSHQPIRARPPSAAYLLRKFARRQKALVGGAVGIVAALVLGLIGTALFAARAADQRGRAEHLARVATDEKHEALHQTYRARISAAAAALQNHDVADAARQLAEAPEELRGWEWHHLQSRLDDRSGRIAAEPGAAFFLLRGPEGLRVGQIVPDACVRLTDLDGRDPRTLPLGTKSEATGLLLQTNGEIRLLEMAKKAPRVWDDSALSRFRPRFSVQVCLSPDGSRLARTINHSDGRTDVALHESASGKRTSLCVGHGAKVWALAFHPDGARLASADDNGLVYVWDAGTGAKLAECSGHTSKVLGLTFHPSGTRLATTSADGTVRQWDPTSGRQVEPPHDRHGGEVIAASYSPDGEWVASGGSDRTIRVWRATGRQEVATLRGHTGAVTEVAFTPDGKRLASVSQDRGFGWAGDDTVGVWDVDLRSSLPVLRDHTGYVYPVAFSPDGRWIASGSWDRTARLWDAATGQPCATLSHTTPVRALAFGPGGEWLVTGDEQDDRLRIWDVGSARVRREIRGPGRSIWFLAVSPDGSRIAATAYDTGREYHWGVYDATSGERLFSSAGAALAYSPDGRWLAVRSAEGSAVALVDTRSHKEVARFTGHESLVHSAAFSPDGRHLVSCGKDRTVRIWGVEGGVCRVLRGHTDEVFAATFQGGGARLASAGRDRAVWVWDLASGEAVVRLQGHTSYVRSLAFSPDGMTLASGSGDFTVRLWDTAPLATRHEARREAAALRPEAERIVKHLFQEKKEAAAVAAALRADNAISEPLRRAALRAVMSWANQ